MNNREHIKEIADSKVFIVEDDEMHSLMMDYMISKESMAHIKKFSSGEECIKNLNLKPDIVILDYGLPGINGMQTFLAIKKYNPDIPVIVITGNKDKQIALKFMIAGVYDYIQKDEGAFEQLSKVINSILVIMAQKEAKLERRQNTIFTLGVLIFLTIITIIVLTWIKH
ncbi:MAG: response regulator [Bacteroidia bacterium]